MKMTTKKKKRVNNLLIIINGKVYYVWRSSYFFEIIFQRQFYIYRIVYALCKILNMSNENKLTSNKNYKRKSLWI